MRSKLRFIKKRSLKKTRFRVNKTRRSKSSKKRSQKNTKKRMKGGDEEEYKIKLIIATDPVRPRSSQETIEIDFNEGWSISKNKDPLSNKKNPSLLDYEYKNKRDDYDLLWKKIIKVMQKQLKKDHSISKTMLEYKSCGNFTDRSTRHITNRSYNRNEFTESEYYHPDNYFKRGEDNEYTLEREVLYYNIKEIVDTYDIKKINSRIKFRFNGHNIIEGFFENMKSLQKITLQKIEEIGESAFNNCIVLDEINAPNLITIGKAAFKSCKLKKGINFPNVKTIQDMAFSNCFALENINLPELQNIETCVFSKCNSIKAINDSNFPKVQTIGYGAFYQCAALENINLPNLKTIGMYAFKYCSNLETVCAPNLEKIGKWAFSMWEDTLSGSSKGSLSYDLRTIIPSRITHLNLGKVKNIGRGAFQCNFNLQTVYLPEAEEIGEEAFADCYKIKKVHLPMVKDLGKNAFKGCSSLTKLYLPSIELIKDNTLFEGSILELILPNLINIPDFEENQESYLYRDKEKIILRYLYWDITKIEYNFGGSEGLQSALEKSGIVCRNLNEEDGLMNGNKRKKIPFTPNKKTRTLGIMFKQKSGDGMGKITKVIEGELASNAKIKEGMIFLNYYYTNGQNWILVEDPSTPVKVKYDKGIRMFSEDNGINFQVDYNISGEKESEIDSKDCSYNLIEDVSTVIAARKAAAAEAKAAAESKAAAEAKAAAERKAAAESKAAAEAEAKAKAADDGNDEDGNDEEDWFGF